MSKHRFGVHPFVYLTAFCLLVWAAILYGAFALKADASTPQQQSVEQAAPAKVWAVQFGDVWIAREALILAGDVESVKVQKGKQTAEVDIRGWKDRAAKRVESGVCWEVVE